MVCDLKLGLAEKLRVLSMHGRSRRRAGQPHRRSHPRRTSPDRPDCSPVRGAADETRQLGLQTANRRGGNFFLKYLCSFDELLSGRLLVLFMTPPGSEGGRLQSPAEGEGQDPGFGQGAVVDGVEVDGGLLFALTS